MDNIQSFVEKTGYYPLDMRIDIQNESLKVHFCIVKQGVAISMDDCTKVTLVVRDFLNMLLGRDANFTVDVSSPGAERHLKTYKEFSLFIGKNVKITFKDGRSLEAVLKGVVKPDKVKVVLSLDKEEVIFPYEDVASCSLVLF